MTRLAQTAEVRVIAGVDTHKDFHVGFAIDTTGRRLGELIAPATTAG